jgi:O-antigen ligase
VKLRIIKNAYIWHYVVALVIGILTGFKFIPPNIVAFGYFGLIGLLTFRAAQGNVPAFFSVLPYAIYSEIFVRAYDKWVPYLSLQYAFIVCFFLLIIRSGIKKCHFKAYGLLVLFTVLELTNNIYPYRIDISRSIITNSIALLMPVIWASYYTLSPIVINRLLRNIKIASIYLAGIVYVAHISGGIDYNGLSNSTASNGLAPVQLSGYLGVACVLFFLAIMNKEESRTRWLNMILLAFAGTVMVLTFSRGGVYFLGAIVATYFYYNRARSSNYVLFIILVPVALIAYNIVVNQTQGKIIERYQQEGASNRGVLAEIGFKIFENNPLIGVGTGNYNTVIVKENLFGVESGAHNEFVRSAAEHGIIGIILYWGFFIALFVNVLRRRQPHQQYAMYFLILFCMIVVHNGLKISLQPVLLMLTIASPNLFKVSKKNVYSTTYRESVPA